jgi:metallo-beta-lactamase family protein
MDGARQVAIFGESYPVRAQVKTIGGISAHASQDLLPRYALAKPGLRAHILVHGKERAASALRAKLASAGPACQVYPDLYTSLEL